MSSVKQFQSLNNVFAATVHSAYAMITVTDLSGEIIYGNISLYQQLGLKEDETLGAKITTLPGPDDSREKLKSILDAVQSGEKWEGELCLFGDQQQRLWFNSTITPYLDEDSGENHIVWVMLNITKKKEAQNKLEQNERRLLSILDNIPAYVFSKDREGRYTYVNKLLEMLHAVSSEQIIGKTDYELFTQEAAQTFTKNDKAVFEQKRTVRALEYGGEDEYGIERSYLSVKCPLENEHGEVEELLGMSVDISEQHRLERALRESEEKLNSILDNMKARVYIKDAELKYTYANQELCDVMQTDRINLVGKDDFEMFEPETAVGFRKTDQEVFETKQKVAKLESSVEAFTKEKRYYWSVKVPLMTAEGEVHSLLGISTDVTEQKRLEEALRRKENQLTSILNNLKAHVYIKDVNSTYTYANADMCAYLGKTEDEVIGKTDKELFGKEISDDFHKLDNHVFNYMESISNVEKSRHSETGNEHHFLSTKVPLINDLGNPYALLGISTDITEQVRLENELREMASTDALTGANNRRHFLELCEIEIERAKRYNHPLSLIMLDVDHFKNINDTHGHAVGDEAIIAMTGLCRQNLRNIDILGRIGGEEFAILLPETDLVGTWQIAQRIRQSTEKYAFDIGNKEPCCFTASFGITSMLKTDSSPDDLLKRADIALYEAKTQGRNRVCEG